MDQILEARTERRKLEEFLGQNGKILWDKLWEEKGKVCKKRIECQRIRTSSENRCTHPTPEKGTKGQENESKKKKSKNGSVWKINKEEILTLEATDKRFLRSYAE